MLIGLAITSFQGRRRGVPRSESGSYVDGPTVFRAWGLEVERPLGMPKTNCTSCTSPASNPFASMDYVLGWHNVPWSIPYKTPHLNAYGHDPMNSFLLFLSGYADWAWLSLSKAIARHRANFDFFSLEKQGLIKLVPASFFWQWTEFCYTPISKHCMTLPFWGESCSLSCLQERLCSDFVGDNSYKSCVLQDLGRQKLEL